MRAVFTMCTRGICFTSVRFLKLYFGTVLTLRYLFVFRHNDSNSHFTKMEVCAQKGILTPPLFIEVSVPNPDSEQSVICVLRYTIFPFESAIFLSVIENVLTVWNCCFFFVLNIFAYFSTTYLNYVNILSLSYLYHLFL